MKKEVHKHYKRLGRTEKCSYEEGEKRNHKIEEAKSF